MRKLKLTVAVLAMTLMAAAPAMADSVTGSGVNVESSFFGNDSVTVGGVTAESSFFGGDIFGDSFFD